MKPLSVKTFVAIGIGAALFFVLGRFASIPVFANTYINIQYALLAFMSVVFGPIAGALIGLIGHALIDFTTYGPWWSWIVTSGIVGCAIGFFGRKINVEKGTFTAKDAIGFNIANIIGNGAGWFLIAPTLDILIYQEPANKVYVQGLIAGAANIVTTAILGTLLLFAYSKTKTQKGSLDKE